MARSAAVLEDATAIRMVLQRLCQAGARLEVAYQEHRGAFPILTEDGSTLAWRMPFEEIRAWGLRPGDRVGVQLKDRGLAYDAVVHHAGQSLVDASEVCLGELPRVLRRSDPHRLADFIPDRSQAQAHPATFTNARNAIIDGLVQSFGEEGLELVARNGRQDLRELMRMGESSVLDVFLQEDLRLRAPATVAYLGENLVGLRFSREADGAMLGEYRAWMQAQQVLQEGRDREAFSPRGFQEATARGGRLLPLPAARILVDRDPLILLVTEREDFAGRLAEALSRRFGMAVLDHIKGPVREVLGEAGTGDGSWGRVRMVLLHNHLRLASPLELCRQVVGPEACPVPVVVAGTAEDEAKKRHHAVAAGAVDYLAVEPFRVLAILRRLEELHRLFEGA